MLGLLTLPDTNLFLWVMQSGTCMDIYIYIYAPPSTPPPHGIPPHPQWNGMIPLPLWFTGRCDMQGFCFMLVRSLYAGWPPHAGFVIHAGCPPPPLANMQFWSWFSWNGIIPLPVVHAGGCDMQGLSFMLVRSLPIPPRIPCWLDTTCRVLSTCSFGPGSPGMVSSPFPPCGCASLVPADALHSCRVRAALSPPTWFINAPPAKIDHPFPTHGGC